MYKSLYTLQKYNKPKYMEKRRYLKIIPKLRGINNETLCFVMDTEMKEMLDLLVNYYKSLNINSSINREVLILDSHSSATIEGARTTVENIKRSITKKNPTKDDLMVINVMKATSFAYSHGIKSEDDLLNVWRIVSSGVLENRNVQGEKYRLGMVYIGNSIEVAHTPCTPNKIPEKMRDLGYYLKEEVGIIESIIAHFYYVYIHPMCDGNGRTARILQVALLNQMGMYGIKSVPWVSELNKTLSGYYSSLKESELVFRENGKSYIDLSPFIYYILEVLYSSMLSYERFRSTLSKEESVLLCKMSKRGIHSEITVANACKILKFSNKAKVRDILNSLCSKGYLSKRKEGNKNVYRVL